ncbi:MAG: hypothetical protein ABSG57_04280 [Candidatus Bathyarchaeia archaeon]
MKNEETLLPRACPLYLELCPYDLKRLGEPRLEQGRCPVPSLITKNIVEAGAKEDPKQMVYVTCPEVYRQNKNAIDDPTQGIGGVVCYRPSDLTTDFRDCQFYSEWFCKYRGKKPKPYKAPPKKQELVHKSRLEK